MGLFNTVGNWLNQATGATSAMKQQNEYQKEFAQNAHQWEVKDLENAGLNPVLSANGTSAGSIAGQTTTGGYAGGGALGDIVNSAGTLAKLSSEITNLQKDSELKQAEKELTTGQKDKIGPEIQKINQETSESIARTKLHSAKTIEAAANAEYQKTRGKGKGVNTSINTPIGGGSVGVNY